MMHRKTAKALVALAAALTASSAVLAQTTPAADPAPASPLTANISLTTNYKFRGQDQDQIGKNDYYKTRAVKPAIQGGFDYAHESGFYVGNWNSSVNWLQGNSIESDIYGGYKFKGGPIDWDVGVLTYIYPGNSLGNTTEIYGAGTYTNEVIGAFTLKYSHTVSKDYFGFAGTKNGSGLKGRGTGYLNLAYSKEIVPKLTLKAAVGYTRMSSDIRSLGYKSYVDYNVGASYDFGGGLSLSGAVVGANKKSSYLLTSNPGIEIPDFGTFGAQQQSINKARFIVTLTKTL
ncbi:TorF family putative porin [Variovorax sp. RT4R15]|uniref:TorF family putative porin n=1 Tax=Variovorax sp. RT4R15 TaxID=3443737 RepID=UPI003F48FF1C